MNYRFAGKDKTLALGVYPDVSLAAARKKREQVREKLAAGIDPSAAKKAQKRAASIAAANSFEVVAKGWMEERKTVVEIGQYEKTLARFKSDVFPWLGRRPITEIDAPEILAVLKRIDGRGARFTAHRMRSEISGVFRFGIKEGLSKTDPAKDLIGAIPAPVEKHFASITEPIKVGGMLRAFDGFSGTFPVLCALKLAPMFFIRPGELRQAEWSQFNLEKGEWRYFVSKTKTETAAAATRSGLAWPGSHCPDRSRPG
jgi:integrase